MVTIVVRPLGITGRFVGKTVNVIIAAVVWTVSGTARMLVRPFTS